MTDKSLRQDVIDELEFEPSVDSAHIGVAVENGVVTLTGHVHSFAEKVVAEQAVRRVKGVKAIAQEMTVRFAAEKQTADDQIAERAVKILAWDAQVPQDGIQVKVQQGWVTLDGVVRWQFQRIAAEASVRKLSGVVGVTNLIRLRPEVQAENVKAKIVEAFRRNATLDADAIRVEVVGDKVRLEGMVNVWSDRAAAERAAWSVPGVTAVEDHLFLTA